MDRVTFRRIDPHEARIYDHDGEYVGDIYRQRDILNPAASYFVIHLSEDSRGPLRVHERGRIREVAERLLETHPLW